MKKLLPFLSILLASIAILALVHTGTLSAQTATDAAAPVAPASVDDSSSTTTIISVIVAVVSGLVAIWQNKSASTAKKVTQSVILGIEHATKLPEVAAMEKRIKATIRQKATDLGVQPLLHTAVRDLTE